MRIYELARKAGVASAIALKAAAECGAEATTAISSVDDGDVEAVRAAIAKLAAKEEDGGVEAKRTAKRAKAAAAAKAKLDADREALAKHLELAKAASEGLKVDTAAPAGAKAAVEPPKSVPGPEKGKEEPQKAAREEAPKTAGGQGAEPAKVAEKAPEAAKPAAPAAIPRISINPARAARERLMAAKQQALAAQQPKQGGITKGVIKVGLSASGGFKPLNAAPAAPSVRITVAAQPKVRPPKAVDYDDGERGNRKDRKNRESQKSFEKQRAGMRAPAGAAQPAGSRITINEDSKEISIRGAVVVKDLAAKLGLKPNRVIADLMGLKILASINQRVEPDVATQVAAKYGFKVTVEHARDKNAAKPVLKAIDADDLIPDDPPETLKPRAPVVTFLGHVDHGKTTLMDWIRKEKVAAGEAGGITQQISAYQVEIAGKKITFLDTPGHAAFGAMRARGAQLTDIAVLIVAADDGIMPQTEECIAVARKAGVQIMVAITKVDKPTANVDRVKQQLQKKGLTPEDWGGDIICCPVSGVTGQGVDELLENILVQAEVLELTANPARRANGYVIEAELQQGLGPCATLLVSGGTLKVGDALLVGEHFGKVRALIDDRGRRIKEAPPSTPVKATGLSGVPEAGAEFRVMLDEKRARTLAEEAARERKEQELATSKAATLEALMGKMAAEGKKELNLVVKSENQGTLEAVVEALGQIKSEKVTLHIIGTGTGNVSLTDVKSAAAGKADVVGFDIGTDAGVQSQARHDGVKINSFRIIYELIDHVKNAMLDLLPPEYKEVVLGHAAVKAIYDIGKLGKIAGSQMLDGKLAAKEHFRILRDGREIWDGKVQTLRHFKDEVKEVTGQQECGVCFAGYEGFAEGDTIECYTMEQLPRSL